MRYANIKKAGSRPKAKLNNNNTTTNINYIKNFMSVLKTKLAIKVKIVSDETETKQNNLQKIWDQSIIRLGKN